MFYTLEDSRGEGMMVGCRWEKDFLFFCICHTSSLETVAKKKKRKENIQSAAAVDVSKRRGEQYVNRL